MKFEFVLILEQWQSFGNNPKTSYKKIQNGLHREYLFALSEMRDCENIVNSNIELQPIEGFISSMFDYVSMNFYHCCNVLFDSC